MKVFIYMAVTLNGMIAKADDSANFVGDASWAEYIRLAKGTGCMIVGSRTYEIMRTGGDLDDLGGVKITVLSSKTDLQTDNPDITFSTKAPKDALDELRQQGTQSVMIAGGAKLNTAFLKAGLVDELILDIEPTMVGGMPFLSEDLELNLELIGTKKLSDNELQVQYRVKK